MGGEPTTDAGREWNRIALICLTLVAAIGAAVLVGGFATGGIAGSPIESILPGDEVYDQYVADDGADSLDTFGSGGAGGLGALNPGEQTGIGGDIGFDNGTFGSNDTEVHFVVESSTAAYWRTGAYQEYTGSGWKHDVETDDYEGDLQHDGIPDEQVSYEITLERPGTAVPTPWRPTSVSTDADLEVTDTGAVWASDGLDAGTTISGVSHKPETTPALLGTSEGDYPRELRQQYTQLPDDHPISLDVFTTELTRGSESPYETATIIQDWLRTEKDYSLNVDTQSDNIAETFVFDMEAGYCEYFATAMTVMLRTQGIPARYTVGYSTGQSIGDDLFEVRGMNAHAWVEVYFEDFGWVKFDPTPGDRRLAAQEQALEDHAPDEDYELQETGSPGEVFEPGEIRSDPAVPNETDDETGDDDDGFDPGNGDDSSDPDESPSGFDVSLQSTPIPGEELDILVTFDGEPAMGEVVTFNGEHIGVTNSIGRVSGIVPESEELTIDILNASTIDGDEIQRAESTDASIGGGSLSGTTTVAASYPNVHPSPSPPDDRLLDNKSFVFDVETNATLLVSGEVLPGEDITVTTLVDDTPVDDAVVTIDDELHGRTDDNGRVSVTIPEQTGELTLAVERETIAGSETLEIPELSVTVEPELPVALPYGTATVEAQYGNSSAADAPVFVDGQQVGTTGPDGTATIQLPPQSSVTVGVGPEATRAEDTVEGMARNVSATIVGLVLLGGLAGLVVRRHGSLANSKASIAAALGRIQTLVVGAVIAITTRGDEYITRLLARIRITGGYLRDGLTGRIRLAELLDRLRAWVDGLVAVASGAVRPTGERNGPSPAGDGKSVQEAWRTFLGELSIHDADKRTPGEIASYAIEVEELPPEAVETLRDAFREVEYGARPEGKRAEEAQSALAAIERRVTAERPTRTDGGGRE